MSAARRAKVESLTAHGMSRDAAVRYTSWLYETMPDAGRDRESGRTWYAGARRALVESKSACAAADAAAEFDSYRRHEHAGREVQR